jgi:NhaP-type Na+/H+ and K+/H+ antiporter
MAVGSDGLGWIYLDDYSLARLIGTVALVVILFEGGLQTGFGQLRPSRSTPPPGQTSEPDPLSLPG